MEILVVNREIKNCYVMDNNAETKNVNEELLPDLSNIENARKAFIASEIFNRKY